MRIGTVAVIASVLVGLAVPASAAADADAHIAGKVTAEVGGRPLSGVIVDVFDDLGALVDSDSTGSDGTYDAVITSPPVGRTYAVCFRANGVHLVGDELGFSSECHKDIPWNGAYLPLPPGLTPVTVTPGQTTHVAARLAPSATITGTVRGPTGNDPVRDLWVVVWAFDGHSYAGSTQTDAAGRYTFRKLLAGRYAVCFDSTNGIGSSPAGYVSECYANVAWNDDSIGLPPAASPVTVAGGEVAVVDARLAAGSAISGTVTAGATGEPILSAPVEVFDSGGTSVGRTTTASDGRYVVPRLPRSPQYTVCVRNVTSDPVTHPGGFEPECYAATPWANPSGPPPADATPVDAPAGVVTSGVDIALDRGGALTGRVTETGHGGGHSPIGAVGVRVYNSHGDLYASTATKQGRAVGKYVVGGLSPGVYTVCFDGYHGGTGGQSECYDNLPWNGVATQLPSGRTRLHVHVGKPIRLDVALKPGGEILGMIHRSDGGYVYGVTVSILDGPGTIVAQTVAGPAYSINGLPPSTAGYFVCLDTSTSTAPQLQSQCYDGQSWTGDLGSVPAGAARVAISTSFTVVDFTLTPSS